MNKLGRELIKSINNELLPFLKSTEENYIVDNIGNMLDNIFRRLNIKFTGTVILGFSKQLANSMVTKINQNNKKKFEQSVGVDFGDVIRSERLDDFISLSINKNVSLIKSLPEQYLKDVEVIVNNGVMNGEHYSEIAKKITAKVGSANSKLKNRIKTIARNEVQTINAQISLRRSEALGIKKGIYLTSGDERVRPCHKELDGVEYDLSKGAWSKKCQKFIQPGITDINCRCSFRPVIEVD